MRILVQVVVSWVVVIGLAGCEEPAGKDAAIEVVSWNMQFFPGRVKEPTPEEEAAHLAAGREEVAKLGADVFCFLEMNTREGVEDLVEALPGVAVRVCSGFTELYGAPLQMAIASRLMPVVEGWELFEKTEAEPPFGLVHAVFEMGDEYLLVAAVHLMSNVGGVEKSTPGREDGARQVVGMIAGILEELKGRGMERVSVVICGDYNMEPGEGRWEGDGTDEIFREAGYEWGFEGVPFEDRATWLSDGRFPDASFDHVFHRLTEGRKVAVERVVLEECPSDHLPVRAVVE